jgi:predicted PurR-regulated permease PerM
MSPTQIAVGTLVVLALVALAALCYLLLDVLLLVFLGIVVASALQPWHVRLCAWGIPKGASVLLIYLLFLVGLVTLGVLVAPVVTDEVSSFGASVPDTYARLRTTLTESRAAPLRLIAERLPPFEKLAQGFDGASSTVVREFFGFTSTVVGLLAYLLSILAIAFYWTMELPRVERLVLSFVPVGRRTHALTMWHEIEFKLGAFMRAQGIAMVTIGVASAIGYAVIGLPNVLVLGVLAGLLEAVPLAGPVLAALPAVLVAFPIGLAKVLWVIGLATLLQVFENNVLMPRLMSHSVGVSALVGLVAVLAFGTLYGIPGVFIAIPLMAVIQVLLDRMLINVEPVTEVPIGASPWVEVAARVRGLRQQVRARLRARDTRMGIDPDSADHVVDARDQQIEGAVERVEKMINVAQDSGAPIAQVIATTQVPAGPIDVAERSSIVERLDEATRQIRGAVEEVDVMVTAAQEPDPADSPDAERTRAAKKA